MLLLLIPVEWIKSIIFERQTMKKEATQQVSASWGDAQIICTPIIYIPYTDEKGYLFKSFFSPNKSTFDNNLKTEIRKLGIFNSVVYSNQSKISSKFDFTNLPYSSKRKYLLNEAKLILGISDSKKINSNLNCIFNGKNIKLLPSQEFFTNFGNTLICGIDLVGQSNAEFNFDFTLRGSNSLSYKCLGDETAVNVTADWPSPSFIKGNLPVKKTINDSGFQSSWELNYLNTSSPNNWSENEFIVLNQKENIVIDLIEPTNHYSMNNRTIKYAFLVISLCFFSIIIFEVFKKIKLHPFQYLLVGLELTIFYLLLISLTEHLPFGTSYIISASSVILIIVIYIHAYAKNIKLTMLFGFSQVFLFSYIFVLLNLEDFALLIGAIGLFIILSSFMILSRKINWYQLQS
jgi:inner membrane protein